MKNTIVQNGKLNGKRILFVIPGFELGGAERQALYLAHHLKNIGCDVHFIGFFGPGLASELCDEMGIPWEIHFFRWPCRKKTLLRSAWGLLKFYFSLLRFQPDIILGYCSWANVSCGLTWRLSLAKNFIWGQRDLEILNGDKIQRLAYKNATAVVCNAMHEIDFLRQTVGETRAPSFVIHNGINLPQAKRTRSQWREKLDISNSATVVVMVANFRFQKDHPTLLDAWGEILQTIPRGQEVPQLILAGAHQESYKSVYQKAFDLQLLDSVRFIGQVDDISGLLMSCDIGVLASPNEGLPNVVIEYMISGLPVVATDLPSTREVLDDNSQLQFYPHSDPDALAARLISLMEDPSVRQELGDRNRNRAVDAFSIDRMCNTTTDIIIDLLERT